MMEFSKQSTDTSEKDPFFLISPWNAFGVRSFQQMILRDGDGDGDGKPYAAKRPNDGSLTD